MYVVQVTFYYHNTRGTSETMWLDRVRVIHVSHLDTSSWGIVHSCLDGEKGWKPQNSQNFHIWDGMKGRKSHLWFSEHSSFEIPFPETFSSWGGEGMVYGWRWVPVVQRVFNLSDGSASSYVSWGRIFCDCLWSQIVLLQLDSFGILWVKSFCSTTWMTWNCYGLACFWS